MHQAPLLEASPTKTQLFLPSLPPYRIQRLRTPLLNPTGPNDHNWHMLILLRLQRLRCTRQPCRLTMSWTTRRALTQMARWKSDLHCLARMRRLVLKMPWTQGPAIAMLMGTARSKTCSSSPTDPSLHHHPRLEYHHSASTLQSKMLQGTGAAPRHRRHPLVLLVLFFERAMEASRWDLLKFECRVRPSLFLSRRQLRRLGIRPI